MRYVAAVLLVLTLVASAQGGLVAYWPFEEGAPSATTENVVQASADNLVNGPTWIAAGLAPVPSGTTAALDFAGGNKQVVVANGYKGVTGTADRTVSAWIRTTGAGDQDIISWGTNSGDQKWVFRLQDDSGPVDGVLRVEINGGYVVGNQDLRDNQWHHVVAAFANDGSPNVADIRLYVDGQLQIPTWQSRNLNTAVGNDVIIGSELWDTSRPFNGDMDDVRIYDESLDVTAIRALAGVAAPSIYVAPTPVASYNAYNDSDGNSTWENQTDLGRTATSDNYNLVGDVVRIEKPATSLFNLHGAYYFDGTGDEGQLNDNPEVFLNGDVSHIPATVEIWFKPDDLVGTEVIWEMGGATDGSSLTLNGDTLQFISKDGGETVWTTFDLDVGDDGADSDDFIQAVASIDLDNDELVFFINGTPVATVSASGNLEDWAGADGAGIAGRNGNETGGSGGPLGDLNGYSNYNGMIANINTYSGALDATQVMAAYRAVALPEPTTLALAALGVGLLRRRTRR